MKAKIILMAIGLGVCCVCFGQQRLFDKFAAHDSVTSVYISKAMFDLIPSLGKDVADVDLSKLKKLEGINILSTETDYVAAEMRKAFKGLITDKHEELMRIRDKGGENITFNIKKNGNIVEELVMLVDKPDGYTVIQILGHFTLQDIQEITVK